MSTKETGSVGVIALGAMGRPAARLLAASGIETLGYDPNDAVMAEVVKEGVVRAVSPSQIASKCSVILVFVPTDADIHEVCSPEDGILSTAAPGSVIVICSSATPATCQEIGVLAAKHGVDVIDAPLVGGVRGAESGTLTLMVGGDETVLDRARWALTPWTSNIHLLGPIGAGQVGKTVNNLCHWGQVSTVIEALTFGHKLGVAPSKLRRALMDSPVESRTLRELDLMKFAWYKKDLANAAIMAEGVSQPLPMAQTARAEMDHNTVAYVAALLDDRLPAE